jgi:hypothetical protein
MRAKLVRMKSAAGPRRVFVKTTVLDLLKELTALTKDDALVLAAMKNIFATRNVRLARTLAPVRLVGSQALRRHRPVWA